MHQRTHALERALGLVMVILAMLVGTAAQAHEYTAKSVTVAHPWVRATPPGATTTAAYLEIKAARGGADRLIAARSEAAGAIELHRTVVRNDIASMEPVSAIAVPSGQSIVLGPSGYHIMLNDLKGGLKEGDLLKLTLQFERAGAIEVEASVEPVGAMGPHGLDHQPGHEAAKPTTGGKGSKGQTGHRH